MSVVVIALVAALVALMVWLLLVAFAGTGIPTPAVAAHHPASSPEEAAEKLAAFQARDTSAIAPACASVVLEPEGTAKATLVLLHGFTNCPNQLMPAATLLRDEGYRVFLPREPRHGIADVMNKELADLSTGELTEFVARVIDIAAGWREPLYMAGLSGGGVLGCWAAATRPEVDRCLAIAPFAAPKGIPMPIVRLLIRFHSLIPKIYFWWDPRKKENLGESPYVYPGFPLPGMVPFMHVAWSLQTRRVEAGHELEYAALMTNPGDFAIRQDCARALVSAEFTASARALEEWTLAKDLGWWHDFVDQDGPHHGTPEQIASVLLTGLGLDEAAVDEGLMSGKALA